jgi:hypothetical protein
MNWYWFSIGALVGLFILIIKGQRTKRDKNMEGQPEIDTTSQNQVKKILGSGDVTEMAAILKVTEDPAQRDALLRQIVATYYRQRSDPNVRELFYSFASQHIKEIPAVLEALEISEDEGPISIDTFKMIAITMTEDGRYDEAIDICKKALSLGLEDGTKTGFQGRIVRIKRRRDADG